MNKRNTINVCGASITRAIVLAVLAKSNLHWEMHQAQVYALELQSFKIDSVVTGEVSGDMSREIMDRPQTNITLMGLPVIIDNARYPKGLVRLMSGDTELSRIEYLAIPNAFAEYGDAEVERERQKFAMLTY